MKEEYKNEKKATEEITEEALQEVSGGAIPEAYSLQQETELKTVLVGGGCGSSKPTCPKCGSKNVTMTGTQDYPLITCKDCGYTNKSSVV